MAATAEGMAAAGTPLLRIARNAATHGVRLDAGSQALIRGAPMPRLLKVYTRDVMKLLQKPCVHASPDRALDAAHATNTNCDWQLRQGALR